MEELLRGLKFIYKRLFLEEKEQVIITIVTFCSGAWIAQTFLSPVLSAYNYLRHSHWRSKQRRVLACMHFHTVTNEIFRASYTKSRVARGNGHTSTVYFRGLCEYFGRSWQWNIRAENVTEGGCYCAANCLQFYWDAKTESDFSDFISRRQMSRAAVRSRWKVKLLSARIALNLIKLMVIFELEVMRYRAFQAKCRLWNLGDCTPIYLSLIPLTAN